MSEYTKDSVFTFVAELGDFSGCEIKEQFTVSDLNLDHMFIENSDVDAEKLEKAVSKRFKEWLIEVTEAGWYVE